MSVVQQPKLYKFLTSKNLVEKSFINIYKQQIKATETFDWITAKASPERVASWQTMPLPRLGQVIGRIKDLGDKAQAKQIFENRKKKDKIGKKERRFTPAGRRARKLRKEVDKRKAGFKKRIDLSKRQKQEKDLAGTQTDLEEQGKEESKVKEKRRFRKDKARGKPKESTKQKIKAIKTERGEVGLKEKETEELEESKAKIRKRTEKQRKNRGKHGVPKNIADRIKANRKQEIKNIDKDIKDWGDGKKKATTFADDQIQQLMKRTGLSKGESGALRNAFEKQSYAKQGMKGMDSKKVNENIQRANQKKAGLKNPEYRKPPKHQPFQKRETGRIGGIIKGLKRQLGTAPDVEDEEALKHHWNNLVDLDEALVVESDTKTEFTHIEVHRAEIGTLNKKVKTSRGVLNNQSLTETQRGRAAIGTLQASERIKALNNSIKARESRITDSINTIDPKFNEDEVEEEDKKLTSQIVATEKPTESDKPTPPTAPVLSSATENDAAEKFEARIRDMSGLGEAVSEASGSGKDPARFVGAAGDLAHATGETSADELTSLLGQTATGTNKPQIATGASKFENHKVINDDDPVSHVSMHSMIRNNKPIQISEEMYNELLTRPSATGEERRRLKAGTVSGLVRVKRVPVGSRGTKVPNETVKAPRFKKKTFDLLTDMKAILTKSPAIPMTSKMNDLLEQMRTNKALC